MLNLASIVRQSARQHPDRPALVAGEHSLTYRELDARARRFAAALSAMGIHRGQHVALLLPNVPEFSVAYFGTLYLGASVVPLNTLLTADEIAYHLDDSDAVALVAWEPSMAAAAAAMNRVDTCRALILAGASADDGPPPSGARRMAEWAAPRGPGTAAITDLPDTRPDDTAVILYTSGTTGRPKGAELTHFNLFHNADHLGRILSFDQDTTGLCALPLFHSFGQTGMQNSLLLHGGCVVLMPRFAPAETLRLMTRHRVSYFAGVPTMYFAMLHEAADKGADLTHLRVCLSGGAPMPVEVMKAFEQRFGVTIRESYGLSETSPLASINPLERPCKPGSIGTPVARVEFRLIDAEDRVITQHGTPGEICIKGYNVTKGYYKRPEATAETIRDGWFRTGDVAVFDEDGSYFIVDRKKDMIIRGGFNVYPREIEEVLYAHPAVAEAAVIGVRHDRHGEEVKAIIACKPGRTVTTEEIIAYCRERLAAYKYPRIVEFRESLPKGPTGKILKREMRD